MGDDSPSPSRFPGQDSRKADLPPSLSPAPQERLFEKADSSEARLARLDFLKTELATYRKYESWALPLLLAAVTSVTYNLIEWAGGHLDPAPTFLLMLVPLGLGLLGSLMLKKCWLYR